MIVSLFGILFDTDFGVLGQQFLIATNDIQMPTVNT